MRFVAALTEHLAVVRSHVSARDAAAAETRLREPAAQVGLSVGLVRCAEIQIDRWRVGARWQARKKNGSGECGESALRLLLLLLRLRLRR
eukprot:366520-Chlamydomonas_euryale.AAC.4